MARDCNPREHMDTEVLLQDDLAKVAFFENLSEGHFEEIKRNGKLGVSLPIEDVPIDFDLSYGDAKQLSSQLARIRKLSLATEHHLAVYSSILSDNGLRAYERCLAADAKPGTYLSRSRDPLTSKTFSIEVLWRSPIAKETRGKFDIIGRSPFQVRGGKVVGPYASKPPREILNNQKISVDVERTLSEEFHFTVSVAGYLSEEPIHLPAYTPVKVRYEVRTSPEAGAHSDFGPGSNQGARDVNPQEFVLTAANEEFLISTAHIVGRATPSAEVKITDKDPKRITWHALAEAPDKGHGAAASGHVSVIVAVTEA
jgi:hypothetical protein